MDKFELISRNLDEILTEDDLRQVLAKKEKLNHYIGFEISGSIHLGTGLVTALKIRDFQKAGVVCRIFLADWHTWINDKLGGDWDNIKTIGVDYFKEGFKASFEAVGVDASKVEFTLGSDLYHHADDYWLTVIDVAKNTTLARTLRSVDILGREAGESIDFAKLIYPMMQVADIFYLGVNLVQAGLDQRKAHVIARAVASQIKFKPLLSADREKTKPIALHQHLILGLQKPSVWPLPADRLREIRTEFKMSKSKPNSAIFIHDSNKSIEEKILKAFCPPIETFYNPLVDWIEFLILPGLGSIKIKNRGGLKTYQIDQINELKRDYQEEKIHPLDLKEAVAAAIKKMLEPVQSYFGQTRAKKILDDFERIKQK